MKKQLKLFESDADTFDKRRTIMGKVKSLLFKDPQEQFIMDFSPSENPTMYPCAMDSRVYLKIDTNAMETRVCIEIEDSMENTRKFVFLDPTQAVMLSSQILKAVDKLKVR